ncbi:heavy-metal-associated domain-containing protein [Micromonospora cremea]|uniref:Copper chaperone CopZ n=1 Tax=Micromonospora cremea TaxID=709881 RepID=A0A1N5WQH1_9ACTN|nr:heavy-metal-associated domain-containing protein [Micromonospora cremea]SIM87498.1 Copper chaperone CopZ [Micromonospora cremea]
MFNGPGPRSTGSRRCMCTSESSCSCATADVNRAVSTVEGVTGAAIDVACGTVAVTSDAALAITNVHAAVEKAGYDLVR